MKTKEKLLATKWRKLGISYGEILKKLNVSKSTLSLWLRDIPLDKKQKLLLLNKRARGAYKGAKKRQKERIERTKIIIEQSKKEIKKMHKNWFFASGLMLYWAEGDKSESTEIVKFTNSDPFLVKLMIKWFKEICRVPKKKIKITLHIHTLLCRPQIEKYWSGITGAPLSQFYKTQIKKTSLKHRRNPLYNGTCAVTINNRNLFRKIKGWKLGIIEISNKAS